MCILECRIGIVYSYDNVVVVGFVVETSWGKQYIYIYRANLYDVCFSGSEAATPIAVGTMGERL